MSEECRALLNKLKDAKNAEEIDRIEKQAARVYRAGCLTTREYYRICDRAMVRLGVLA